MDGEVVEDLAEVSALHRHFYDVAVVESGHPVISAAADGDTGHKPLPEEDFLDFFASSDQSLAKCLYLHFADCPVWNIPETRPVVVFIGGDEVGPVVLAVEAEIEVYDFSELGISFSFQFFSEHIFIVIFLRKGVSTTVIKYTHFRVTRKLTFEIWMVISSLRTEKSNNSQDELSE